MFAKYLFVLSLVVLSSGSAFAQEFGIAAGVHQSTSESRVDGLSTSGNFGFRAGLTMSFLLEDNLKFRSGLMFVQRHFDIKDTTGESHTYNWDYFDVPALIQYNFNEMVGIFGGLNIAINTNHSVTPSLSVSENKALTPIFTAGVNLLFDNMYGFDLYYERGVGNNDVRTKNPSAFGATFIYYFL